MSRTTPEQPDGPGARLLDDERPWWHLNVASDAFFYAVIGRLADHILRQANPEAALRRAIRELYKAVRALGGDDQ